MRTSMTGAILGGCVLLAVLASVVPVTNPAAQGQTSKTTKPSTSAKKPAVSTKQLDIKSEQMQSAFIKEAEDLAGQYFDAGQFDKAKSLLEAALALNPQQGVLQQKLKKIEETILTSNDIEYEVNPAAPWTSAGVQVFQDRPIRIQAEGTYKMVLSSTVSAEGYSDKDPAKDMLAGIPFGALAGMVFANGKVGKPFLIADGKDFTPRETGQLFLRVNAPPDNKNTGKIKVTISGYVRQQ